MIRLINTENLTTRRESNCPREVGRVVSRTIFSCIKCISFLFVKDRILRFQRAPLPREDLVENARNAMVVSVEASIVSVNSTKALRTQCYLEELLCKKVSIEQISNRAVNTS